MLDITQIIEEVKTEFEGGNSLPVNWDIAVRLAVKNVMRNTRPEELKRVVPLYGGLAQDLFNYYAPPDILAPSDIYNNTKARRFSYSPNRPFYASPEVGNVYTIETVNGRKYIVMRHSEVASVHVIDAMDTVGTKTGGNPTLNQHNFILGSGAIEATFDDTGTVEFGDNLTAALDITPYLRGVLIIPIYLSDATKLNSLELRLKTTDANYYKVVSTADSIGDYFSNGWNYVRFDLANKVSVGSPTPANITEWSIIGDAKTGTTVTVIFDRLTIQKFAPYYFQYYSNRPFVNGENGEYWQADVSYARADKVLFEDDLAQVLHYELCLVVNMSSTYNSADSDVAKGFKEQLVRAWQNYWADHPSDQALLTYNIGAQISKTDDIDFGTVDYGAESLDE